MLIISDTTPIISLAKVDKLELLNALFDEVIVPDAVYNELTGNPAFEDEADMVKKCSYVKRISVQSREAVNILRKATGLDLGESEAIVCCEEVHADMILMDEKKGRYVAAQMGMNVMGTLGILLKANEAGLITREDAVLLLDTLQREKIRISDNLVKQVISMMK